MAQKTIILTETESVGWRSVNKVYNRAISDAQELAAQAAQLNAKAQEIGAEAEKTAQADRLELLKPHGITEMPAGTIQGKQDGKRIALTWDEKPAKAGGRKGKK